MTMAASDGRREMAIQKLIARFGEFKRVVRMCTGVAYKVPRPAPGKSLYR